MKYYYINACDIVYIAMHVCLCNYYNKAKQKSIT